MPFVGEASYDFKKKFSKLVENKFPVIVKSVFSSVKVGNFFISSARRRLLWHPMSYTNSHVAVMQNFPTLEKPNDTWLSEETSIFYLRKTISQKLENISKNAMHVNLERVSRIIFLFRKNVVLIFKHALVKPYLLRNSNQN